MTEAPSVPPSSIAPDTLLRELDGPAFAEPWMAQAFACTVYLSRRGLFTWNEWVDVFSTEIKTHPQQSGEAANAAYYRQWLAALETMVGLKRAASTAEISERQETWRKAILTRRTVSRSSCITPLRRRPRQIITATTTTTLQSRSASVRRGGSYRFLT